MQKFYLLCAAAVVAVISSPVSASPYTFDDLIDKWTVLRIDAVPVVEGIPLRYQHDLTNEVDFARGDCVTQAWLELDFTNDLTDAYQLSGWIQYDFREYARIAFDGAAPIDVTDPAVGEVDAGQYTFPLNVNYVHWLNDGKLDAVLDVYNFLGGLSIATAYLDHSRLYGTAAPVPVPGAVLLGLLGLGYAGRKLRQMC